MASTIGQLSRVAMGKESTWGTPVAGTVAVPFLSEGFKYGPEAIEEAQIMGILDKSPIYKGMNMCVGQLSGLVYPVSTGHILQAAFGASVRQVQAHPGHTPLHPGKPLWLQTTLYLLTPLR